MVPEDPEEAQLYTAGQAFSATLGEGASPCSPECKGSAEMHMEQPVRVQPITQGAWDCLCPGFPHTGPLVGLPAPPRRQP